MPSQWWQLPGPKNFVSRLVQDLLGGKNLILQLPLNFPPGLRRAVKAECDERETWAWCSLEACKSTLSPSELLFSYFVQDNPLCLRNAYTLASESSFNGKLIWVKGIDSSDWAQWKKFITEYEQACRSTSLLDRTLFCIELVGEVALDPPGEDLCLALHAWNSCVDDMDMLLYSASLYRNHQIQDLYKRVCISVTAKIAAYDPIVAERLADDEFFRYWDPRPTLLKIGSERAWNSNVPKDQKESWWRGMADLMGGEEKIHSAFLALRDDDHEIQRRIWSGQVGVLLPFVEERRRDIINRIGKLLKVPHKTNFGVITDVNQLEINHVFFQVKANGLRIPAPLYQLLKSLTRIRNSLSHFQPTDPMLLKSQEIRDFKRCL